MPHQRCWMAALMQLYPETSASCLCPYPCVYGSGDGGDGGGLCLGPGPGPSLQRTEPDWGVPGHSPSARHPGNGAVVSARMLSAL